MDTKVITSTEAARSFSEILNIVRYQGKSFDIKRGKDIIARIVPPAPFLKASELKDFFDNLPTMSDKDREAFAKDITDIRKSLKSEDNPWE